MDITPGVLEQVRKVTSCPGWTAEPVVTFSTPGAGLLLTAPAPRRGVARPRYLIIAQTTPDAFRALAECLSLIGPWHSR